MKQTGWRLGFKRALDRVGAGAALVAAAPLMAATAVAIRTTMGGPVLFRQVREGRDGDHFEVFKFKTMRNARPDEQGSAFDAVRLTRLGRLLRRTSIDELPQLWNVLRGEMSLVGPRPLILRYGDLYTPDQRRRLDVLPGMTGWAQVNGRNARSWDEKFDLDLWYVDHWSVRLDVTILARTVDAVVRGVGVSSEGHATMPEFTGSGDAPS